MEKTMRQFDQIMAQCKAIWMAKQQDYGSSWRIMRPSSLTDQLYIKAKRIIRANYIKKWILIKPINFINNFYNIIITDKNLEFIFN